MRRRLPSRCTVCTHDASVEINLGLARRVAIRALSRRFKVSIHALYRHAKHLPPQVKARLIAGPDLAEVDLEKLRVTESSSLLANVVALRARLFAALDEAESYGDTGHIARISGQLHENFGLVGRLLGDLGASTSVTVNNILIAEPYLEMRAQLIKALQPFPAARLAVAKVLHKVEEKAAADMIVIEGKAS